MASGNSLCPLPFTQLYLHSTGDVSPCSFTQSVVLGNVKDQSLLDIWQGEKLQEFRSAHLKGGAAICNDHQKQFFCHLHHERLKSVAQYSETVATPPLRLDFMLDSFCNLKCVMCTNVLEDRGGYDHDEFWDHCKNSIFPFVKEIEIIGGEPFILPHTSKLVEMVTSVNPDCLWRVTTNAAYQLGPKLKKLADQMKFESLAISIDSLKEATFAKIRLGGDLNTVLSTTDSWIDYAHNRPSGREIKLVCNFVIQKDNAYELPAFLRFCEFKGLAPYPIILVDPTSFSVLAWSEKELSNLVEFYFNSFKQTQHASIRTVLLKLIKQLPAIDQALYLDELKVAS